MAERRITGPVNNPGRPTGIVVQVVNTQTGVEATGTTVLPRDDTIPQITEGDEYMTLAITPKNTNNTLIIQIVAHFQSDGAGRDIAGALFQDSTANALAASATNSNSSSSQELIIFNHTMTAGTVSATTLRFRAGANAGTTTFNGTLDFGDTIASSITIWEIAA